MVQDAYGVAEALGQRLDLIAPPVSETGGIRADAAISRYREGMTDEAGLRLELGSLGWPDNRIEPLVVAARLAYAFDRTQNLISTYSEAYREGAISEASFREHLGALGIVPQRIEDIVLEQNVRAAPTLGPIAAIGELAYYKTEAGRQRLATLKYEVREGMITEAAFREALPELGIPPDLADALADYEAARLVVEPPAVAAPPVPYYKTEPGKQRLANLKYAVRQELITIADFRAALPELEIPPDLADALAEYEELREIAG